MWKDVLSTFPFTSSSLSNYQLYFSLCTETLLSSKQMNRVTYGEPMHGQTQTHCLDHTIGELVLLRVPFLVIHSM